MCSIAGAKEGVKDMLRLMRHRAPDDEGVIGGDFEIGMGRLSIVDLQSPGLCPLVEGNKILAFNGEIYNYKELRQELIELGHKFYTTSDTEVLLKSYIQWGIEKALDRFNGMFAFAIKDGDKIILARDIAGQKPLYFRNEPFAFASEAKALHFKCKEFPPACYGVYKNGKLTIRPWWIMRKREIDPETAEEELEKLIEDSVRLRTQTEVPYALFYSGGVDSTLISTFHDFKYKFTYHDRASYSRDYEKVVEKIVWHLDYPIRSFSPYGLWTLAKRAHNEGIKVILSGEGADELFGGYVRYVPHQFNYDAQSRFPSYKGMFPTQGDVNSLGWEEFNGNMRELLRMGDRMTSAFGVENRCPFLDRRIIEFAFSLPADLKIKGLDTKILLRKILKRRMPEYQMQEKHGLYVSVNKWLGEDNKFSKDKYVAHQEEIWQRFQQ